jgi:N-acetylmuramoyl-L-alanine amidase
LPLRLGQTGEAVRDLQRRLGALGLAPEVSGGYGPRTERAVRTFQEGRGLVPDGVCGPDTWSALVEAGFRLGDRLLYLRRPMLRGDDVVDLQARLGALGFDAGRVDGIFGPDTERALRDFQRNAGLVIDGVCGPDVIAALARLGDRVTGPASVAGLREREVLEHAPPGLRGRRIAVGEAGGLDALATAVSRALQDAGAVVLTLQHPDASMRALDANGFEAEVYLDLAVSPDERRRAAFYSAPSYESAGGRRLAELVVHCIWDGDQQARAVGMRLPILRETRMPAVVCHLGAGSEVVAAGPALADRLGLAVVQWVEAPIEA